MAVPARVRPAMSGRRFVASTIDECLMHDP
jgi:hypothetical protein